MPGDLRNGVAWMPATSAGMTRRGCAEASNESCLHWFTIHSPQLITAHTTS
jgi:hypothetical protein